MKRVNWNIPAELHERLQLHSNRTGIGVQEYVSNVLSSNVPLYRVIEEPANA